MQKQDKNPKPRSQAQGQQEQLQQIRQNVENQVAQLRQHIQQIQQQSLQTMMEAINTTFKTQSADNLQQLARQEQETMDEATQAIRESELQQAEAMKKISGTVGGATPAYGYDAGTQAMENAQKGVEQAMKSAMANVMTAEKSLYSSPAKQDPHHPSHPETERKPTH